MARIDARARESVTLFSLSRRPVDLKEFELRPTLVVGACVPTGPEHNHLLDSFADVTQSTIEKLRS